MSAIKKVMPSEKIIYVFDRKHAPYGTRSDRYIKKRARKVCSFLALRGVKMLVVACNTATATTIESLRKKFSIPIIGVEPPVKQAVETVKEGKVLLLCTVATARQKRIKALIEKYGEGRVEVLALPNLASRIEEKFSDLTSLKKEVFSSLAPYKNAGITAVVLGCTHYYHIKGQISEFFADKATVFTAEEGVAKRVKEVLIKNGELKSDGAGGIKYFYL